MRLAGAKLEEIAKDRLRAEHTRSDSEKLLHPEVEKNDSIFGVHDADGIQRRF